MKKLIIAVAAVAMGVSAQAKSAKELDAQAYDFSATVKSTQCKEVKFSKTLATLYGFNYADVKGQKISVRKQASTKIVGVIWGCNCETIARPDWRIYDGTLWPTIGGYLFWNSKTGNEFNIATTAFGWAQFNRIDDGSKVEGVWALVNDDETNALAFLGAGFGKVSGTGYTVSSTGLVIPGQALCRPILTSMSGSFAGFLLAGSDADGCLFCGSEGCQTIPFCVCYDENAYAWDTDRTAAYGTWSIKYNKSVSNKLRKTGLLSKSYSFKKVNQSLVASLEKIENAVATGVLTSEDAEEAFEFDDEYEDEYEIGTEHGAIVDRDEVAKYAYLPETAWLSEDIDDLWEAYKEKNVRRYSETEEGESNLIVNALLSIAAGDEGDAS